MSAASHGDENLFRLLVESAKDYAIFVLDPNGVVSTWNEGAARINGYNADEIIGKHFSIFYPPEDVAAGKCEMELRVAAAEGRFEDEGIRLRKDGSPLWANVIITALRNETGNLIGFAKVTRDLTERRRREEERVRQALRGLLRVHELGAAISAAPTARDVIEVVVTRGAEALGASASSFTRLLDEHTVDNVMMSGISDELKARYARMPVALKVPSTAVWRSGGKAEWVESEDEFRRHYPDSPVEGSKAACSLPVAVAGRVLGAMTFRFLEPRVFTTSERAFLETFAFQAALALDRIETQRREDEVRRRLEQLRELAEELSGARSTSDVARVIVERSRLATKGDTATLHRYDESVPALALLEERGVDPEVAQQIRVLTPDEQSPSWRSIETGHPLWVETQREYSELYPALNQAAPNENTRTRVKAFWAVPLVSEGRHVGLLGVGYFEETAFPPDVREFIATFTRQCAEALLRAKRLEDEQQARASLATTLRSIGDAVIATDAQGHVTMMNPIAEALTGWSESEARGHSLSDVFVIINEHTRAPVISPVDKVLELGTIVGLANHTVLIAKDGKTEIPIDDSGAPIRSTPDGKIEGVVLVFRDVTEKKRDDTRRSILEEAGVVLATSLDYEVTLQKVAQLAVPRFADWVGVDLIEEDTKLGWRQVAVAHVDPAKVEWARELGAKYPPDKAAPAGVPNVLRTGKSEIYPEVTEEMIRQSARGEEHLRISLELHIRSVIIVPLLAHGRILGALSFVWAESGNRYSSLDLELAEELARRCANAIDNARLYDAEQQARASADVANRAKDEFLATVSHELRTPLNAIMGWAKMLSSGALTNDVTKQERAIATIDRNAVAMAQLIEDLLDISRIISGKMRIDVQSVHLGRIIEAAIDAVRPAADAKDIKISERTDIDAISTMGDPARLQQVVWNLLSNAVKFTPKGGSIDVELVREEAGIDIVVADTGKGIHPRFLPHVFEAFRQEDASHTRSRGGLGLGLAITKQLVELHGGSVSATSAGEGKGATFHVHLPAGSVTSTQLLNRTGRVRKFRLDSVFEQLPQLSDVHVLVVDDEEDARLLLQTVLEQLGARVTLASSAAEALAAMAKEVPDVLVSDIGMPTQDGYDLIREVRKLPPEAGGNVPATALTAYARAEDRRQTIDAGFTMHVSKPVDPAELVAVLSSLTRKTPRP